MFGHGYFAEYQTPNVAFYAIYNSLGLSNERYYVSLFSITIQGFALIVLLAYNCKLTLICA